VSVDFNHGGLPLTVVKFTNPFWKRGKRFGPPRIAAAQFLRLGSSLFMVAYPKEGQPLRDEAQSFLPQA
jgi:hypothetical protein